MPSNCSDMQYYQSFVFQAFSLQIQSLLGHDDRDARLGMDSKVADFLQDIRSFTIPPGSLELTSLHRHDRRIQGSLNSQCESEASFALDRKSWQALQLADVEKGMESENEYGTLLKVYDPNFTHPVPTFPRNVKIPASLDARTACKDSYAFKITTKIDFLLGAVERLWCRMVVYDVYLNTRVTEEISFELQSKKNGDTICALAYILGEYSSQHLYLVFKISKVLGGDPDIHIAPYLQPEKYLSPCERHKLLERVEDCEYRLAQYRQPLAWGATPLVDDGRKKNLSLYRQRTTMSENHRMLLITDAARGTIREKIMPASCEVEISYVDDNTVDAAKYNGLRCNEKTLAFALLEPFHKSVPHRYDQHVNGLNVFQELQPFCHPSLAPSYGLTGSGPVAVATINVLYLYPLRLERMSYRNIAIRVQLLCKEIESLPGIINEISDSAIMPFCFYGDNDELDSDAFTSVSYHHKNPQFDEEIKIALPDHITAGHHLLFTFYHVHCKRLKERQNQQEVIGYAVLPLLNKCGHILQDVSYVMEVELTSGQQKLSAGIANITLPSDYLSGLKDPPRDVSNIPLFTCKTRLLSSIHSQNIFIANFLKPYNGGRLMKAADRDIVREIVDVRHSPAKDICYFLLLILERLFGYICFGTRPQRQSAFYTVVVVLEKTISTLESLYKHHEEQNVLLDNFAQFCMDDRSIVNPMLTQEKHRVRIYESLLVEWLAVLNGCGQNTNDHIELRRLCLKHTRTLIEIVIKSLATNLMLDVSGNKIAAATLPSRIFPSDSQLMYNLIMKLTDVIANSVSENITVRKSINSSVAWFCKSLYLIVQVELPSSIICYHLSILCDKGYQNYIRMQLVFSFIKELIEFEHLITVNGFNHISSVRDQRAYGWLYQLLSDLLLQTLLHSQESKIRREALRLLRRMLMLNAYDPAHLSQADQEEVALMYLPILRDVLPLTYQEGISGSMRGMAGNEIESSEEHRALLICVAHLLCSISAENSILIMNTEAYLQKRILFAGRYKIDAASRECTDNSMDWIWLRDLLILLRKLAEAFLVEKHPNLLAPNIVSCKKPVLLQENLLQSPKTRAFSTFDAPQSSHLCAESLSTPPLEIAYTKSKRGGTRLSSAIIRHIMGNAEDNSGKVQDDTLIPVDWEFNDCIYERIAILQNKIAFAIVTMLDKFTNEVHKALGHQDISKQEMLHGNRIVAEKFTAGAYETQLSLELFDLYFLLLRRSTQIPELCKILGIFSSALQDSKCDCFVLHLFRSMYKYIGVTQRELFGYQHERLAQWNIELRLRTALTIIAHASDSKIRKAGAVLLLILFYTCFENLGTFYPIEVALLSLYHEALSTPTPQLDSVAFYNILQECKICFHEDNHAFSIRNPFRLFFAELLKSMVYRAELYTRWQDALKSAESKLATSIDYEELEEELYAMSKSISSSTAVCAKLLWLNALERLHLVRNNHAEAACCRCSAVEIRLQHEQKSSKSCASDIVSELQMAAKYTEDAGWVRKSLEIHEQMLPHLRRIENSSDRYEKVLENLGRLMQKAAVEDQACDSVFYRALIMSKSIRRCDEYIYSQLVPETPVEYIYKRSKFISLTDFMNEIKLVLQQSLKASERTKVEILPELKAIPAIPLDDTIYVRICAVDPLPDKAKEYQYATPFTLTGSSYTSTRGQMKKVSYLSVDTEFPCLFSRQKVLSRQELYFSPIECSIDDIHKRTAVLVQEIDKDARGRSELKMLTLILKGSVEAHVNGGVPEIIKAYFGIPPENAQDVDKSHEWMPILQDVQGNAMTPEQSHAKRLQLANAICNFLSMCKQCLAISRKASESASLSYSTPLSPSFQRIHSSLFSPTNASSPYGYAALEGLVPLQLEFEKSFEQLLQLANVCIPARYMPDKSHITGVIQE